MNMKKSTVAKHVFGELTLKDIMPLIADCDSVTVEETEELEELAEVPFKIDRRKRFVEVFESKEDFDRDDDDGVLLLFPEERVVVKQDCVEYSSRSGWSFKMHFHRGGKPVNLHLQILGVPSPETSRR